VIFEPLDFIARIAALIPEPRVDLTRFHGDFAPNSKHRALITPDGRGKSRKSITFNEVHDQTVAVRHAAMTWLSVSNEYSAAISKPVRPVVAPSSSYPQHALAGQTLAGIGDPGVIRKILDPVGRLAPTTDSNSLPEPRALPQTSLFGTIRPLC
jgi:hypothetical protein